MVFLTSRESILRQEFFVIRALVLRDIRTRFGAGFVSYLVAVGYPLSHLLALMIFPVLANRVAPLGTDYALYAATGVLPYILCFYPARMLHLCIVECGPLLGFPIVKPLDVLFARAVLETVVAFTVTILFLGVLFLFGLDIFPYDPAQATAAIMSTIFLGIAIGFIGAILFKLARAWFFVQIVLMIMMYVTSGAFFMPRMLSPELRYYLFFNPLFHSVEWLRLAYYKGYGDELLNRGYLLGYSLVLFAIALISERAIRGRMMMA